MELDLPFSWPLPVGYNLFIRTNYEKLKSGNVNENESDEKPFHILAKLWSDLNDEDRQVSFARKSIMVRQRFLSRRYIFYAFCYRYGKREPPNSMIRMELPKMKRKDKRNITR